MQLKGNFKSTTDFIFQDHKILTELLAESSVLSMLAVLENLPVELPANTFCVTLSNACETVEGEKALT